jgi:hypothetical protein
MPPDTDILNDGFDALVTKLGTITGLRVTTDNDPRNVNPPCVMVEAPAFLMPTNTIAQMDFTVKVLTIGPGDRRAVRNLLQLVDLIRAANIGLTGGRPTVTTIGGADYASYELTISTKVAP